MKWVVVGGEEVNEQINTSVEKEKFMYCFFMCVSVGPAAVGVAAEQNLSTSAADGAVGLVTVIIVHVGNLQVHVLDTQKNTYSHIWL